ncbi:hypothetical protein ACRAWF_18650 [Streptomyces sp. L7]
MTITAVTATRTGQSLVTKAGFSMLSTFCADEYSPERSVAARVVDRGTRARPRQWARPARAPPWPSPTGRPRLRTLVLHTDWYANWCAEQFGYFVHHQPNSKTRTRGLMTDVVGKIRAAGFEVDERLWGTAAECNAPACCGDGPLLLTGMYPATSQRVGRAAPPKAARPTFTARTDQPLVSLTELTGMSRVTVFPLEALTLAYTTQSSDRRGLGDIGLVAVVDVLSDGEELWRLAHDLSGRTNGPDQARWILTQSKPGPCGRRVHRSASRDLDGIHPSPYRPRLALRQPRHPAHRPDCAVRLLRNWAAPHRH